MNNKELSDKLSKIVTESVDEYCQLDALKSVRYAVRLFSNPDISDDEKKRILSDAVEGVDRNHILQLILLFFGTIDKLKKSGNPAKWQTNAMRCLQESFSRLNIIVNVGSRGAKTSEIAISKVSMYPDCWRVALVCGIDTKYVYAKFLGLSKKACILYDIIGGEAAGHVYIEKSKIIGRFRFL